MFFFLLICIATAIVWICNKRNISSSLDESAIFTQPRAKVTDVIATQGNFSSHAGKGQRRRWSVHTFEHGQRASATATTAAGGRRPSQYLVADARRQDYEPGLRLCTAIISHKHVGLCFSLEIHVVRPPFANDDHNIDDDLMIGWPCVNIH